MFQTGDFIISGSPGFCEVPGVQPSVSPGKNRLYYTLSPRYSSGTIYTPVDSPVFMRRVITREQAESLIGQFPNVKETASPASHRQLAELYEASLKTYDCTELLRVIKTAYLKTRRSIQSGRKPGQTDRHYLKRAETQLFGELAAVLDIRPDEVRGYIENSVKG